MLSFLARLLDRLEKIIVVACCIGIVVLIFAGVLSRYVFHFSIAWSEEFARFLFLWGSLFGAAAAFKEQGHGGLPILVERLPRAGRRAFEVLCFALVSVFLCYLVWQSWATVVASFSSDQHSIITGFPIWTVNAGMLLAFALAVVRNVQGYRRGIYRTGAEAPDPLGQP